MSQTPVLSQELSLTEIRRLVLAVIQSRATPQSLSLVNTDVGYVLELVSPLVSVSVLHAGPEHFHAVSSINGREEVHILHFFAIDLYALCARVARPSTARFATQ